MQVPMTAGVERAKLAEPIRCAPLSRQSDAQRLKDEVLRYLVVTVAFVAVLLLIAIAFYYTQGNTITVKHVSSLHPYLSLHA